MCVCCYVSERWNFPQKAHSTKLTKWKCNCNLILFNSSLPNSSEWFFIYETHIFAASSGENWTAIYIFVDAFSAFQHVWPVYPLMLHPFQQQDYEEFHFGIIKTMLATVFLIHYVFQLMWFSRSKILHKKFCLFRRKKKNSNVWPVFTVH